MPPLHYITCPPMPSVRSRSYYSLQPCQIFTLLAGRNLYSVNYMPPPMPSLHDITLQALHYWLGGTFIWVITCHPCHHYTTLHNSTFFTLLAGRNLYSVNYMPPPMPSVPPRSYYSLLATMPDAWEGPLLPKFTEQPKWDQKSRIIARNWIYTQYII